MLAGLPLKILDLVFFTTLILLGIKYYIAAPYIFDLLVFSALAFVAIRKPDINTLTLILILFIGDLVPLTTFYFYPGISGYAFYFLLFIIDISMIITVWLRPFILCRYGPHHIKHNQNIALTHQDSVIAIIYTLHGLFQLSLFIEHLLRHLDDVGLEGLFGSWKPMMFYQMYPVAQFGFSILVLVVLYLMTFDKSKHKSNGMAALQL